MPGLMEKQHGFSLIEVLVALVILSVGMLGIAGLFASSMAAGRSSIFRQHAIALAGDIADRIRANPRAGAAYAGPGADNNCTAAAVDCDEAEMASHDIFLWGQQARDTLPGGAVSVGHDDTLNPPRYTIAIDWDEPVEDPDTPLRYAIAISVLGL